MRLSMRLLLLGVLAGLAACGPPLIEGDALGSDSVVHASIDGHSTEAARSAPPGFETAGGTSQRQAGGASRNMLGVPTDVQRKIDNRGSLGGPRKTCSAFDGCRGGGDYAEKMVSVELAGAGAAGSSAHHAPSASASLGEDACAEVAKSEKCVMNECACATSESWDASGTCGADGGETLGHSRPTIEIAQGEKLHQTGARGFVRAIVDKISTLVTVTQQGPLRSERMACADLSQENAAEDAVLTAAVLPFAHERGAPAAATTSGPIAGDTDHGRFDLSQWLSGGRGALLSIRCGTWVSFATLSVCAGMCVVLMWRRRTLAALQRRWAWLHVNNFDEVKGTAQLSLFSRMKYGHTPSIKQWVDVLEQRLSALAPAGARICIAGSSCGLVPNCANLVVDELVRRTGGRYRRVHVSVSLPKDQSLRSLNYCNLSMAEREAEMATRSVRVLEPEVLGESDAVLVVDDIISTGLHEQQLREALSKHIDERRLGFWYFIALSPESDPKTEYALAHALYPDATKLCCDIAASPDGAHQITKRMLTFLLTGDLPPDFAHLSALPAGFIRRLLDTLDSSGLRHLPSYQAGYCALAELHQRASVATRRLVARAPVPDVNACMDRVELRAGEKLVWHFRHGESAANAAGQVASEADGDRGDGLCTERQRHEADADYADARLTATGIAQAQARRADLGVWRRRPSLIVSSPLTRALQTAAYIFADDLAAGVPLVVRPELREFFPNLAQDAGRPLAALRSDPAIRALPNASVVLSALSNEACAQWRHEWDEWQANGSATGARARSWQAHCADGGRIADFKAWLHGQGHTFVATVSHYGTVNALVNHEPCVEASGQPRRPAEEVGGRNAFAWRLGVLPPEGGMKISMPNCGHLALVYSEEDSEAD
ncbi:hypothetical protein EMIHUDRAFT_119243 [Emiliania huxleyi CCMP1516]|uniref:Uncharacterized protein n=2 Tax=Emiliania huxleyi TaxID=2903 RepID=A0A0D3IX21_EMIH1|nr:hypothetical protein EMIHUDRAFT_119243 [Emiliania huxleyi CCMP1516]EOD15806.1 hypothetical protein EMIHUDRAFT_119243 [Emiliania huxleyi CCMP1516]|eukprot:XP_005768235.1 hypothetical protein EMIHUDRAFT_119243 [Emiliania huxleyi CCMP1516]